ncbi:MAG: thioredoxin domain-containing protein [Bifidobacteriaceae bacterium]|jgi:protein-disulfide isomerase|nr:thioredoxin domain-containing protein [Bifidobacteriaceae bacterium]
MARGGKTQTGGERPLAAKMRQVERNRRVGIAVTISLVVVVVGIGAGIVAAQRQAKPEPPPTPVAASAPAGALDDGGILIGQNLVPGGAAPEDAVTVRIITDFLCPYCGLLEQLQGETLAELAEAGEIRLVIHPINYLKGEDQDYSLRAQTAALTVAALEPERFWEFYRVLWVNQPPHAGNGAGLSDARIAELAKGVGVSAETVEAFQDSPITAWAEWSTAQGRDQLGRGTPTVRLSRPGSEPVWWQNWSDVVQDEDGNEAWRPADLPGAVAKVKAGQDPNAG